MYGTTLFDRPDIQGVAMAKADGAVGTMRSVRIMIVKPGDYRVMLPTEDEARELERTNPEGKLFRVDGRPVWFEPEKLYGESAP